MGPGTYNKDERYSPKLQSQHVQLPVDTFWACHQNKKVIFRGIISSWAHFQPKGNLGESWGWNQALVSWLMMFYMVHHIHSVDENSMLSNRTRGNVNISRPRSHQWSIHHLWNLKSSRGSRSRSQAARLQSSVLDTHLTCQTSRICTFWIENILKEDVTRGRAKYKWRAVDASRSLWSSSEFCARWTELYEK